MADSVRVTDIDVPFASIFGLLAKVSLAAVLVAALWAVFGGTVYVVATVSRTPTRTAPSPAIP